MINDKMIYQANNHPCAWYYVYIKNQLMKLIVTRSRWDDVNDNTSYRSQYQNLDQINPSYQPNKLKAEYEATKKQKERLLQYEKQDQPVLNKEEYREKKVKPNQYPSENNLRTFNQNQVDDFNLFDDRDQLGSIKNSSFSHQADLKSYSDYLTNDDFNSSNNYLNDFEAKFHDSNLTVAKLGSSGFNDSLASLKQRMDDIDQQIGNYESITRELSDLANSNSFNFDYNNHSNTSTLGINDFGLNSSSSISSTSGLKDLNSYEFNESTKDMLLHHSEDFND